jgi:hypothetical protein
VDGIVKAGGPAGEALLDDEIFLAQQALEPPGPTLGLIEADAAVGAVAGVGTVAVGVAVAEADDVFFHDFSSRFSFRIPFSRRPSRGRDGFSSLCCNGTVSFCHISKNFFHPPFFRKSFSEMVDKPIFFM